MPKRLYQSLFALAITVALSACGGTNFRKSLLSGDTTAALRAIDTSNDVNTIDIQGYRPIHYAAHQGGVDVISKLIEHGADMDSSSMYGTTALIHTIENEQPAATGFLLARGASVQSASVGAVSPLMVAASKGNMSLVKELLDKGAAINERAANGTSALFVAILYGQNEVALYLLDNGADTRLTTRYGWTLLHAAAFCGSRDMFSALVERSETDSVTAASLSLKDDGFGETSMASARAHQFMGELLDAEGNGDAAFQHYEKAQNEFRIAAERFSDLSKALMAQGASADSQDAAHQPLLLASFFLPIVMFPAMIAAGANIENSIMADQSQTTLWLVPDITNNRMELYQRGKSLHNAAEVFDRGAALATSASQRIGAQIGCRTTSAGMRTGC